MPGATSFADVPENRTRVVIVDADHRVREGVVAAIELAGGLEVVGQAGYLLAAVSLIAETSPDAVILDPRLPDVDGGTALVTSVRKLGLSTRILLMSWSVEQENADLVKAVDAFIDKCAPPEAFVQAIVAGVRGLPGSRRLTGARVEPDPDPEVILRGLIL